ncbi:MAG: hypothetical protein P4L43_16030 [Syntrophobacteraceae bacterium]|nr:hypothetical protein [Syntrophobacteraceae bacterium]
MSNNDIGAVSWELFNELYESQYDLLRKLKFITRAAKMNGGESIALELIEGYLKDKERELGVLRDASLEEWSGRETAPGAAESNRDPGAPVGADT